MLALPITGWSTCNAAGSDVDSVWATLAAGAPSVPRYDIDSACGIRPASEGVPGATPLTRLAETAVAAVEEPIAAAAARWGDDRVALVVATTTLWFQAGASVDAAWADLVGALRQRTGATGPAFAVSTACSSSAKALGSAQRLVLAGAADAVVVVGADVLTPVTVAGFRAMGVLSDAPCAPFGADRSGVNLGEGAACAVVERAGDPLVLLLGVGDSSDGASMVTPDAEGHGPAAAITAALAATGVDPGSVGHINAHATGTVLNDRAEAAALHKVFDVPPPVVATKGATGHLLGAAGLTEVIVAGSSLRFGLLPPSTGSAPLDPQLGLDVVVAPRPLRHDVAISTSFGFGGSNTCVVLGAP